MPTNRSRPLALAALAVLLLALFQPSPADASPWTSLWSWLSAWTGPGWISATGTSDHGPLIDPNGRPSATGTADLGPSIDPEGQPLATPTSDHGPSIDPLGGGL